MTIQIDSREKAKAITKIVDEFCRKNVRFYVSKLYTGDYMNLDNPKLIIDRKHNLLEVCQNVCQDHTRFTNELKRANDVGIKLIFLIEHSSNIKTLEDIRSWVNPRLKKSPMAVSGERLYKILSSIQSHYNTQFLFCSKYETGRRIIELLS